MDCRWVLNHFAVLNRRIYFAFADCGQPLLQYVKTYLRSKAITLCSESSTTSGIHVIISRCASWETMQIISSILLVTSCKINLQHLIGHNIQLSNLQKGINLWNKSTSKLSIYHSMKQPLTCEMMGGGDRHERDLFVHIDVNSLSVGQTIPIVQSLNGCGTIDQPKYASPLKPLMPLKKSYLTVDDPVQPAELVHDQSRHVHFFSPIYYRSTGREIGWRNTDNYVHFKHFITGLREGNVFTCVCPSVSQSVHGGPHVTIAHDALDFTVQGASP